MGKMISFKRPDGKSVNGYLAEPAQAAGAAGMVVIQEWWGLNDQIKGVADKLAKAGYRALVPDLYRGKVAVDGERSRAPDDQPQLRRRRRPGRARRGAAPESQRQLQGRRHRLLHGRRAHAALGGERARSSTPRVAWYGFPPLEYIDATKIKAPLLGHYAIDDVPFPIAKVDELEKKLRDAEREVRVPPLQGEARLRQRDGGLEEARRCSKYNPQAAELAWKRTMEFFDKHLKK